MIKNKTKIGIIGCGVIGGALFDYILSDLSSYLEIAYLCDINKKQISLLKKKCPGISINTSDNYNDVIENVDFVIESAVASVSGDITKKTLLLGKDIMVLSIGGLLECYDEIYKIAHENKKGSLYLPSGAIGGIDCINAAAIINIEKAEITSKKHPKGLEGAPYLIENNISLDNIKDELVVFEGTAREAIKGFPKNVNVSALLSLASIGLDKTMVKIITSNKFKNNIHEIFVKGDFGELRAVTNNVPSPLNPKTSYLAALSACAMLAKIFSPIKIGS